MQLKTFVLTLAAALSAAVSVSAQTRTAVGPYDAVTDRVVYAKPAVPALGAAGSTVTDPVFQSVIHRVTDKATRPGLPNRSYRTPSSPHQNAWSANSSYFYVTSGDGSIVPFAFDAASGTASRIQPSSTGAGGLVLSFYVEPQFSYVNDSIIYGSRSGGSLHTIDQYDFSTGAYTRLFDLDTVTGGLAGTYIGGISSSAGATERILVMYGGTSQDRHHLVVVFDKDNPSNRQVLDTTANTLNGLKTAAPLSYLLHHAVIDRSGRYVMLYPTAADQASTRKAPQEALWDLATGTVTELGVSALPYGHDAFGYGTLVNQDCCTKTTWDAAQWQFRNLSSPLTTRDLLPTVVTPKEVQLADHTSWNNARPDRLTPVVSGIYRYGANSTQWRAFDDEIVAIQTDAPGSDPTIWRFAHHRSNIANDLDPTRATFWYMPRPNVSDDGRWVLFTSNWEKTLGTDPTGESGASFRQDVFIVELKPTGSAPSSAPSTPSPAPAPAPAPPRASKPAMWIDAPGNNATIAQPFTVAGWAIDTGAIDNAGVDAVDIWVYPSNGAPPIYAGSASHGGIRPDIAAAYGAQFAASGFQASVRGLAPGTYMLAVFAHSRLTNTFNNVATRTVTVAAAMIRMAIDAPGSSQSVGTRFTVGGWAFDPNAASGSGVDAVHVWAYPTSGAAPMFVGAAAVGGSRPDVAAYFGAAAGTSGYNLAASLPAGVYDLVVYIHSSVSGTFGTSQAVRITVR